MIPDTAKAPNPRPYRAGTIAASKKLDLLSQHGASASSLQPNHIFSVFDACYYPQGDIDSDGFQCAGYLEWDIDTDEPSSIIHVQVWGRDSLYRERLIVEPSGYRIYGSNAEWFGANVFVPYHGRWDFKLLVLDSLRFPVAMLNYGSDSDLVALHMESPGEDAAFGLPLAAVREGPDVDFDAYRRHDTLVYVVEPSYDSTYLVTARIFARNSSGPEFLHLVTQPFYIYQAAFEFQPRHGVVVAPGMHDYWDFRIELRDEMGEIKGGQPYLDPGPYSCWTNLQLERWNEDPRMNTVFMPNPIHSLNDSTLWDHADSNEALPSSAYWSAGTLPHRTPPGDRLDGDYVAIRNLHTPNVTPPQSADGVFPFFRHDQGFEAVMCYFWIDWNQTYVQNLGFTNACHRQIEVDPHGWDDVHNAQYGASAPFGDGTIVFGDGGTDAAEDGDLILHEYCHAIIDNINPGMTVAPGRPNETRAIGEGTADYWAASAFDSLYPTAFPAAYWAEWFNRSSPSLPPFDRRLNTIKHYPDSLHNEPHLDGEIWSACLWQMKEALGKRVTDSLCLRSFQLMRADSAANPTFLVGASYILRSDTLTYAAAHSLTIAQIFLDRGILSCDCPHQGDINADLVIDVFDVIAAIGIVFSGDPDVQDLACPTTRADVNNDAAADLFDVIYLIDHSSSGGPAPLDPCAP